MKIHILSPEVASRIAAGEVVERPASVVKELIENSLDAGATEISVSVAKSGTSLIRITDNGEGMSMEDLPLAVERHSTSKLTNDLALFRISTLGFRGEALPSIASVSRMEITSRTAASDTGYRLRLSGGNKEPLQPTAAAVGTTVEVRDIFFNTPVRRKFLKSLATELSHICDVFNRLALAYSGVHFRLTHDDRIVAEYVRVTDPRDRLHQVLGRAVTRDLIPFSVNTRNLAVSGYLSSAPSSFPNSRYLLTFVNRRYVRDKVLNHAVLQGYETLLMKGQYPAVVLFLEIPYEDVDVNVHPAKYEVRFRRQSDVHAAVCGVLREKLKLQAKEPWRPASTSEVAANTAVRDSQLPYVAPRLSNMVSDRLDNVAGGTNYPEKQAGFFSSLFVLGQILGCYLVCSSSRGLVIIDQHAAHERVVFERFRQQLSAGRVHKQQLLVPQTLEVSAGEALVLEQTSPALERFGFAVAPFGPNLYAVTAAPALLPEGDYRPVVQRLTSELAEIETSERAREQLEERLATIACHSVIRANRTLQPDEIRALLEQLDQVDFATQCPHGRPVLLELNREDLERMFRRV